MGLIFLLGSFDKLGAILWLANKISVFQNFRILKKNFKKLKIIEKS